MRWPRRLSTRLAVSFTLLFAATFVATAAITLFFAYRRFEAATDETLSGVAATVTERLNTDEPAQDVVDDLSTVAQFVEVVDLQDRPIAASPNLANPAGLRSVIPRLPTERHAFHTITYEKSRVRVARLPRLDAGGNLVGYVLVATPATDVTRSLQQLTVVLIAAGVLGIAFSTGGTVLLARREARPLTKLAGDVRTAAASGFQTAIQPVDSGSEEARELGRALAELVKRQGEVLQREREFFADSSHVLRTPVAVLKGDIEILEHGAIGREREEVLQQAHASIDTLSRMLNGLLLLSREQESGQQAWEVIDVSALVGTVAAEARTANPELNVVDEVAPGLEMAGDPHQLRDLFTSIVENACRYTRPGGSVTVGARATGEEVEVTVADTGIGFSEDDLAGARQRFYRGRSARALFPGGSGLGLAIADRVTALHAGSLELASNDGGGAKVTVHLPRLG
jgi:two-component system sensor histidine kinase BaeS